MGGVPFGDARGQAEVYDEIRALEVEREKIIAAGTPDPKKTPLTAQQRARLNVLAAQRKDLDYAYIATDDPVERARIRRETDAVNRAMGRVGYDTSDPAERMRSAYDQLAGEPGDWVSIADLRDRFPEMSREEMDTLLRDLEQRPDVNIVPQANEKALSDRTRRAAVRIGGQEKHFIAMGIE